MEKFNMIDKIESTQKHWKVKVQKSSENWSNLQEHWCFGTQDPTTKSAEEPFWSYLAGFSGGRLIDHHTDIIHPITHRGSPAILHKSIYCLVESPDSPVTMAHSYVKAVW